MVEARNTKVVDSTQYKSLLDIQIKPISNEEELNDLRRQNATSWETTKYHLKLAKTNTSLRNIEQLTFVTNCEEDNQNVVDVDDTKKNGTYSQTKLETPFIDRLS